MEADRQHICRETKAYRLGGKTEADEIHKTMTKALPGRHNVKSNHADWQFGSCIFSRLCLLLLWLNQNASQITLITGANKVSITTVYVQCNLLR